MQVEVTLLNDAEEKSKITDDILKKLPAWFGDEKAIQEFVTGVRDLPFFAAMQQSGDCAGFVSIKIHHEHSGDIYVCGVLPEFCNQGIGKKLFAAVEEYLLRAGCKYLFVKTLDETANYEPYEQTRRFYKSIGFDPLVTLREMWDKNNPCLIMIKVLQNS